MNTIMPAQKEVEEAYTKLYTTTEVHLKASYEFVSRDAELKVKINKAVAVGQIAGKNQTERDASTQEVFANELSDLELLKDEERQTRIGMELARIEVERVRSLLRLLELKYQGAE